jgi:S1-C subfamily serine protease/mono/diheme cytochrome c family protein
MMATSCLLTFCTARPATASDATSPDELVFLLQYIGVDYGIAVRGGVAVDAEEYREVLGLSEQIVERYDALRPHGGAGSDIKRFHDLILDRADWGMVRALSQDLVRRVTDELDVVPYPPRAPDLESGRELYRVDCAPCHGAVGGGDGPSAASMTPKPTSFRGTTMSIISPHQVYNAATFGVPATAMPSYRDALPAQSLWEIAFFVMTLRDGFERSPPVEIVPLTLPEIAASSDEELLRRLRASRPGALASEVDFYRAEFLRPAAVESNDDAPPEDGLEVAQVLERTFAHAAEKIFPSVVGISVYAQDGAAAPVRPSGWREGSAEEQLYPGFHRAKSGSGFLVTGDGDILTCARTVTRTGSGTNHDVVDVELAGNVHCRARIVGIEPSIDLAVLKIVAPVPVRSATIGDSDRVQVGHWAIAVGDPPGPERIFAPGTVAARPERECYQEHRTSTLIQSSVVIDDAALGGPLVNIHGAVIGLTVSGPAAAAAAIGAPKPPVRALPINLAMTIYRALKVAESERSPWIGISVLELNAALRARLRSAPLTGIAIDDVFEPSPASRSDIRVGDVLTRMDDHAIMSVADFQTWLYILGIDARVRLEIVRDGKTLRKDVTIQQRPNAAALR